VSFEAWGRRLRVFETAHDHCVLPGVFMVARIDGRSFSQLTRDPRHGFGAPYDERFRDCMLAAATRVMSCGFASTYAHTQSDEISVLFRRDEAAFGRKLRKYLSVLAGEASAAFSLALGAPAAFDCRISQLPREEDVVEYFLWRQEDAHRNALNGHCYWLLRTQGHDEGSATRALERLNLAARNELLFQNGINFNDVPAWHKRGIGLSWEAVETEGRDPRTGAAVATTRRALAVDRELPLGEAYAGYVRQRLAT
jgi:tRNA(His) 5'-end guanylyltransferase